VPGHNCAGPLGTNATSGIDQGTLALTASPVPGTVGAGTAAAATAGAAAAASDTDPEIEALNLRGSARKGAYALKKAHPAVKFTSGRRNKEDQARAMASNVVLNRTWIEETYASSTVSKACQKWVNKNPTRRPRRKFRRACSRS
jgi:hypothetical protein